MKTLKKYLCNCIIGAMSGLLFTSANSISANDLDKTTWDTAVQKTRLNADICSKHVQSAELGHAHTATLQQCNKICRRVANTMEHPKTTPSSKLLAYAKQCDEIFNKLPAEYQNSPGLASEEKPVAPSRHETTEDITADIEQIAKDCEGMAEQFSDPQKKRKAKICQQNCLATARKIQSGHISPGQAGAWRDVCEKENNQAETWRSVR